MYNVDLYGPIIGGAKVSLKTLERKAMFWRSIMTLKKVNFQTWECIPKI